MLFKNPIILNNGVSHKDKQLLSQSTKKGRDKRFIKNWRPILLLNVDTKLISKVLAERYKNVLPDIISKNQTAHVNNLSVKEED